MAAMTEQAEVEANLTKYSNSFSDPLHCYLNVWCTNRLKSSGPLSCLHQRSYKYSVQFKQINSSELVYRRSHIHLFQTSTLDLVKHPFVCCYFNCPFACCVDLPFVRCCVDSVSKEFTTFYIDAYSMQKWAVAGQRPDTKLDGIQTLIFFIKVAREHGGVVLGINIFNPAILLEYFKGVKGQ